jgi:hypothetical protein
MLRGRNAGDAMSDDTKDKYNFSKTQRGRFFRADAVLVPPKYQENEALPKGNIYDTK